MEKTRLNIELFKKVRERIATIPQSYNQRTFVSDSLSAPCGTVCCIAGETIICNASTVAEGVAVLRSMRGCDAPEDSQWGELIAHKAQELLGLDDENASALFEFAQEAWPEPFRGDYILAESDAERAQIAVELLDHVIKTGSVLS